MPDNKQTDDKKPTHLRFDPKVTMLGTSKSTIAPEYKYLVEEGDEEDDF